MRFRGAEKCNSKLPQTQLKLLLSGQRESGAWPAQEHKTCATMTKVVAQGWRKSAQAGARAAQGRADWRKVIEF